jgi:hypothetical protein
MSPVEKSYCSLYTFIKRTNAELFEVLDDLCIVGLVRTRNDITFLNPDKNLTKKLVDMVQTGQSEEASYHFKKLFLYGKHTKLDDTNVNYNNKKNKSNLTKLSKSKEYRQWGGSNNVAVFDYNLNDFPEEGDNVERPNNGRGKGKGKRGSDEDNSQKILYTMKLMMHKNVDYVIYALNSLLKHVSKSNSESMKIIKHTVDPNMILSWYILVQPGKQNPDYIDNNIFNEWALSEANDVENLEKNTEKLTSILEQVEMSKESLMTQKKARINALNNAETLSNLIESVHVEYDDKMHKLLEDELRFRYSDCDADEMFEHIIDFAGIDWNNIEKNLVLLGDCPGNLLNTATHHCLLSFVNSNAFKYTTVNNELCKKLANSISGAGINGGKKTIKMLGNTHRDNLNKTKSVKTMDVIESLLHNLSNKERKELKEML